MQPRSARTANVLLMAEVARHFFEQVVAAADERKMLSEHFSVDGTLIEAWASLKRFRRKDEDQAPPLMIQATRR